MSDLVSRLRERLRPAAPGAGPAPRGPVRDLGSSEDAHEDAAAGAVRRELCYEAEPPSGRSIDVERVAAVLGGEPIGEGRAACVRVTRRYDADRRHGTFRIGDGGCDGIEALRMLDRSAAAGGAPLLFFDLETTGLSGGAGTLAFLVGCAWFDAGALQVEQWLLTTYAAERALLARFGERVHGAGTIVSYNGRTFDAPLLDMRWQFHRARSPLAGKPHADMLHPARRLWRWRAREAAGGACTLAALERALFGVERALDVPGFEIPARYFGFLRSGDAAPLEPVLEHNRMDLVSLAVLTARVLALLGEGSEACRDGWERLALGRLLLRLGDVPRALGCFERAAADPVRAVRAEALARIAAHRRRERRHREAAEAWQQVFALTAEGGAPRDRALARDAAEALAVHHEHRARDLDAARALAHAALRLDRTPDGAASLSYRLNRIERKMQQRRAQSLLDPPNA